MQSTTGKRKAEEQGSKGRIGFDPDTCSWFESPVGNFFITNDEEDIFLFGKGDFGFTKWSTRTIEGPQTLQTLQTPSTTRNAVFLVNPAGNQIIFFKPIYDDIWSSDSANGREGFHKKALDVLTKLKSFGIMSQEPFFVSMDTPLKTVLNDDHTWHQDNFPMIFMPQNFQTALQNAFGRGEYGFDTISNYTMIEYTSKCASTAVKLPGTKCDYARFEADKGVVVCVNNIDLVHSSPIVDRDTESTIDRAQGNETILSGVKKSRPGFFARFFSQCEETTDISRLLYRTQIKVVSQDAADAIIADGSLVKVSLPLVLPESGTLSSFQSFTLSQYLTTRGRFQERGGARKRKTMRKRSKNFKKTKKSKTKRRRTIKKRVKK
jgi:hypothetical protein